MKIVLISPHGSLIAHGLRLLGACLQEAGHTIRFIFLPLPEEIEPLPGQVSPLRYETPVQNRIVELCEDAGLVGITCATTHFPRLAELSDLLRRNLHIPVIWGGIHPTVSPRECLDHADWICRGEGEETLVEFAEALSSSRDPRTIPNLGYLEGDKTLVLNPLRPLLQDLDVLPFPLYSETGHYILHHRRVVPLTSGLACWYLSDGYGFGQGSAYHVWATRGCPHRCAYCCNSFYSGLYPEWNRVRRQSNSRIIAEIYAMRRQMPWIDRVAFMDDTFFAAPAEVLEDFSALYRREIGLPFFACASPSTLDARRLDALTSAGLRFVWVGMQSGSLRIQRLYQRHNHPDRLVFAADLLSSYRDTLHPPVFDFIIDPTFQNAEDQRLTLKLLERLAYPFQLALYSMTFFPGTEISKMAGFSSTHAGSGHEKNMVHLERTFYRAALWAHGRNLPKSWLRLLSKKLIYKILAGKIFIPVWWLLGFWLEKRDNRQLVTWTTTHRRKVVMTHFPDQDWRELAGDLFGGQVTD
jgi:radical SAM superfamily enzyme YgiQ (UPF0313 family)